MLLEPVWVSSLREVVPSHLAIVLDDSESMRFSDPYTDNSRAVALAADMKLESAGGKTPVERLRETPRLGLVQEVLRPDWIRWTGPAALRLRPGFGGQGGHGERGRSRASSTTCSRSGRSRRWAMRSGACWRRIAASRSRASCWRPTGGRTRARTRSAPRSPRSGRTSRSTSIAAGADEGPRNIRLAEIEASPVVFVRDPMTLGVVVEARGLKDAEATVVLEQRINEGGWEPVGSQRVVLGEDGILKRTTFRITPKAVGQYEYRRGSRTPAPSSPRTTTWRRPRCGSSASRSACC